MGLDTHLSGKLSCEGFACCKSGELLLTFDADFLRSMPPPCLPLVPFLLRDGPTRMTQQHAPTTNASSQSLKTSVPKIGLNLELLGSEAFASYRADVRSTLYIC